MKNLHSMKWASIKPVHFQNFSIPSTSKKTIIIATGAIYFIIIYHVENIRTPHVDPDLISSNNRFRGILNPTKIVLHNAPSGIKMFETK